jgi:hypothetical protein
MDALPPKSPAKPNAYEKHFTPDGVAHGKAPKWAKYRTEMTSEFPLPYRGGKDPLAEQIGKFVGKLDMLRPEKGGPAYLGNSGALTWTYPEVKDVKIAQEMGTLDGVLDDVVGMFNGLGNWGSPLTMCNVLPQGNTAAIMASMMAQVFAPSLIEGEYSWNVQRDGRDARQPDRLGPTQHRCHLHLGRQRLLDLRSEIRPDARAATFT